MKEFKGLFFVSFFVFNYCNAQIYDGYTDKLSYRAGETVTFYTKSEFSITPYSDYWLCGSDNLPYVLIQNFVKNFI